jgi:transcriptional regulator with XRE-family HTH domain
MKTCRIRYAQLMSTLTPSPWQHGELTHDGSLADLVHRARAYAGLSQAELAERLGTSQPAVSRWERGHDEPRWSTLVSLLSACGLRARLVVTDDVDRAQIRQQLAMSPADRLRSVVNVSRMLSSARPRSG